MYIFADRLNDSKFLLHSIDLIKVINNRLFVTVMLYNPSDFSWEVFLLCITMCRLDETLCLVTVGHPICNNNVYTDEKSTLFWKLQ